MAVLTTQERAEARSDFVQAISNRTEAIGVNKADLLAAIDAVDQWVNDNQASYNSALPVTARTSLTASQKAEILLYVVRKRFRVGA